MATLLAEGIGGLRAGEADEGLPDADVMVTDRKEVKYDDLQLFTNDFSRENRIGRTQFGILYRGTIPQGWRGISDEKDVTIKVWDTKSFLPSGDAYHIKPEYLRDRMQIHGSTLSREPPIVGKVVGYCCQENKLGVVYDVKPSNRIFNIMSDKDKFGWRKRVKVALELARFLKLCHGNTPRYLVRNLSAAHVIVDQDFNPVIVDFAMILGGDLGDGRFAPDTPLASYGYHDNQVILCGVWQDITDVFTFGVILLELIFKYTSLGLTRALKAKEHWFIFERARGAYKNDLAEAKDGEFKFLFVSEDLQLDPDYTADDGTQLSMLAMRCVDDFAWRRPRMEEVVSVLEKLHVIKHAVIITPNLEKARYRLEVEIGKSPPLSDEDLYSASYDIKHKFFKVALLKFTGYKRVNNISDTEKAFLIILITDIFLGYHSESGWQTLLEIIVEHYGLEVDRAAITIFVYLVPVVIDACVKLWLFKFLPRFSPKVANIFQEMKRH